MSGRRGLSTKDQGRKIKTLKQSKLNHPGKMNEELATKVDNFSHSFSFNTIFSEVDMLFLSSWYRFTKAKLHHM
jgi:hypothetical protein